MRRLNPICFALALTVLATVCSGAADRAPNFLVILADDLGWADLGHDGSNIDLMIAGIAAATLIFVIMLVITRSVVAAFVIVGTVLLSLGASFGLSVLVWQYILGMKLHWMVLAMAIILLLAVGSDYNLLLISRFKEEIHAGLKTGTIRAMAGSGSVVTSAGLVFAATMATFMFSPLLVIGNVRVTLYARSSLINTDFFVRLCDVDENGVSTNICDGLIRKTSSDPAVPDDIWKLNFKLHATAHCFKRDHRIRLIVSSGAHPRYARNTGTSEPFGTATKLATMQMEIFHDPARPSAVHLPVHEV